MDFKYDVFEILPDGFAIWRARGKGTQNVLETLKAVGEETSNECFAIDLRTKEIIGCVNEVVGMEDVELKLQELVRSQIIGSSHLT